MRWTKEQEDLLREIYPKYGGEVFRELYPEISPKQVSSKTINLGIKYYNSWSTEDVELLKIKWPTSSMEDLLESFPGRSYGNIMNKAGYLKIKCAHYRNRKSNLNFLDILNDKSVYWWGFIMADGHLSNRGDLIITLSNKDKNHLLKLSSYLECEIKENKNSLITLSASDIKFGEKWRRILNITEAKTYKPPNLDIFTDEYFIPFLTGFIDGDGSIWKSSKNAYSLRIELHGSWINILDIFSEKLKKLNIQSYTKISKKGYSQLNITKKGELEKLKDMIHDVDFLERKWNIIS